MARLGRLLLIVSLFSCVGWAAKPGSQAGLSKPRVIVSVYNQAGVPDNVISKAEQETGRVLREASVLVSWVNGPNGQGRVSVCQEARIGRPLMVRIVPQALTLSDIAFGAAFLGSDGDGEYADIFFDSLQRLQDGKTQVSQAQLLGYVMAHEIGHLLLGSNAHSNLGIMRPHWSTPELQSISMGRLSFTPDQCRQIHQRLDAEGSATNRASSQSPDITVTSWLHQDHPLHPRLP
jgi:hypothetical protein